MKLKFTKRSLTNVLIITFGVLILMITILLSLKFWLASADVSIGPLGVIYPTPQDITINNIPTTYRVNHNVGGYKFLEIYNQDLIQQALGSSTGDYPAYKIPYDIYSDEGPTETGTMAVVPLSPYDLTNIDVENYNPSANSAAMQFYNYAKSLIGNNQSSDLQLINQSIDLYNQAIQIAAKNYAIDQDRLYSIDQTFKNTSIDSPDDIRVETYFPARRTTMHWSLSVSIASDVEYYQPTANGLALRILNSAKYNAANYGTAEEKTTIDNAIARYQSQIGSTTTGHGLTLTTPNSLENGADTTISYSVNYNELAISNDKYLKRLMLNIQDTTVCTVTFANIDASGAVASSIPSTPPLCEWNQGNKTGTFRWTTTGSSIDTTNYGAKTITLKAFDDTGTMASSASKTVNIMPATGNITTPGSGVVTAITVPSSVDKSDADAAKNVEIRVSGSNLNPNGVAAPGVCKIGNVCKFQIYICPETAKARDDSTGCQLKEQYGPFQQNSFTDKVTKWDASGTAAGNYFAQVKIFGMPVNGTYPDYPDAQHPTRLASSTIVVVDNMNGGGDGGGEGPTGPSNPPSWASRIAANFQSSDNIRSISSLLSRLGPFTLLILGILAVIAIIIAGMRYITSGGDPKGAESGKKALLYAIYGIIAAVLCVMLIQTTVSEVKGIVGSYGDTNVSDPNHLLETSFKGVQASVSDIFNQDGFIWRVINLALYYAEAVAVFYILYASFLYITSFGEESKAEAAKKTLVWAIIGLAFILSINIILVIFTEALH